MKAAWCGPVLGLILVCGAQAQSHGDKSFLETASQGNVAEVELGKLALKKSTNGDVRAFAKQMIHDHQALGRKMTPLLAQAGVKPSVSLNIMHQHLYNELNGKSGSDFDKAYIEAMVKDHHEDLKDFQDEVGSTQDPQIKTTVSAGEKVIAEHTQMVDTLAQKMGVQSGS